MAKAKRGQYEKLNIQSGTVCIVGDSPIMLNRFSAKAAHQMLAKMMGLASAGREKREPEMDFIRACQFAEDGHMGVSAIALKSCAVRGAKATNMMPMTDARCAFRVIGDAHQCIPVYGKFVMDRSMVRIANQGTDIRFRPRADEWAMEVPIRYNAGAITSDQIMQLFENGGFGTGLAEWRQENGGIYGTFEVSTPDEVARIRNKYEASHQAFLKEWAPMMARVAAEGDDFLRLFRVMKEEAEAAEAESGDGEGESGAAALAAAAEADTRAPDAFKKMGMPKPRRKGTNGSSDHLESERG